MSLTASPSTRHSHSRKEVTEPRFSSFSPGPGQQDHRRGEHAPYLPPDGVAPSR